jgi:hypothetical protein
MKAFRLSARFVCAVQFCLTAAPFLFAQGAGARIAGRVVDSAGAFLPGVRITIVSGLQRRDLKSGPDGRFVASDLPPGAYVLTAELTEFRTVRKEIEIVGSETVSIELALKLGCLYHPLYVISDGPTNARWALKHSDVVADIVVGAKNGEAGPGTECATAYTATVRRELRSQSFRLPASGTINILADVYSGMEPGHEYVVWLAWKADRNAFVGLLQDEFVAPVENGRVRWRDGRFPGVSDGTPVMQLFNELEALWKRTNQSR